MPTPSPKKDYTETELKQNLNCKWKHMLTVTILNMKILSFPLSCPDPGRKEEITLNFHFQTSLWCLKRFYESLKGLYKTF